MCKCKLCLTKEIGQEYRERASPKRINDALILVKKLTIESTQTTFRKIHRALCIFQLHTDKQPEASCSTCSECDQLLGCKSLRIRRSCVIVYNYLRRKESSCGNNKLP